MRLAIVDDIKSYNSRIFGLDILAGLIDAVVFISQGMAKIAGSFFLAMPSTGSFTRSAINHEAGSKTGMSSILGALFVGLIIMFFGNLFYYLPEPILAAIVITSVFSLINIKEINFLFKVDRSDFWVLIATFLATLIFGIVNGIVTGILFSLFVVLTRISKTSYERLGQLPGTDIYRSVKRFADAKEIENTIILRIDQIFMFGNALNIFDAIIAETAQQNKTRNVVLAFSIQNIPDSSAINKFKELIQYCHQNKLRLVFTDVKGPVRDYLNRHGLYKIIGGNNFYLTISDAIKAIQEDDLELSLSNTYAKQTNNHKNQNDSGFKFWNNKR